MLNFQEYYKVREAFDKAMPFSDMQDWRDSKGTKIKSIMHHPDKTATEDEKNLFHGFMKQHHLRQMRQQIGRVAAAHAEAADLHDSLSRSWHGDPGGSVNTSYVTHEF
jgi:hypothetical protein